MCGQMPPPKPLTDLENDLSKLSAMLHPGMRFGGAGKRQDFIDHGLEQSAADKFEYGM
jgi:hypothetical protein